MSAADVKLEITVLVRSLKSSILSSTSSQLDDAFWGVGSAAVEQTRRKASWGAQGKDKFGPWGWGQGLDPLSVQELKLGVNTFSPQSEACAPIFAPKQN